MVKAIIFDLQGTLVENGVYPSPVKQVRYILGIDLRFHEYVPEFEKIFMTRCFDSLSEGFKAVAVHFDLEPPDYVIEKLVGVWNKNKLLSKPFPEAIDVLTELKKDYKLILVSNIDCFSKDIIEKYSLQNYFDQIFLSCDTGFLKTNPKLFELVLEKSGLEKQDVVMVGDSMESDIRSAEEAGISAILVDRNNRMIYSNKISGLHGIKDYLER
jgi:HAD superfamily hydrolase (TIGR01493 family)